MRTLAILFVAVCGLTSHATAGNTVFGNGSGVGPGCTEACLDAIDQAVAEVKIACGRRGLESYRVFRGRAPQSRVQCMDMTTGKIVKPEFVAGAVPDAPEIYECIYRIAYECRTRAEVEQQRKRLEEDAEKLERESEKIKELLGNLP